MDNLERELIEIYVKTPIGKMQENAEYVSLCEENKYNSAFNEYRSKIEKIRKQIEKKVLNQESIKNQVKEALIILKKKKRGACKKSFTYAKKLVEGIFFGKWSQNQKEYFDDVTKTLERCCSDYFLSFTSRKPNPKEINILHMRYKFFIKEILVISNWDRKIKEAKRNNTNLLAETINKLLSNSNFTGYYYPDYLGDNRDIEDKICNGCNATLFFIQLVQNIMFERPNDRTNYCFFEYQNAEKNIPSERRLYILAEDRLSSFIDNCEVCDEYDTWHMEVEEKDKIHLQPVEMKRESSIIKANKEKITNGLVNILKQKKKELLDNVPD